MRHFGFLPIAILTAGLDTQASAHEPPLFTAFKSFCVNTGGGPDAVKPAVEMAGGKALKPPTSSGGSYPMTALSWSVTIAGHKMIVTAGTLRRPYGTARVSDTNDCTVVSYANEDAGIAKIQEWVGIAPDPFSDTRSIFYNYQERGETRLPLPADKDATASIMAAGHSWSLVIRRQTGDFASVQLTHLLGAMPAPHSAPGRPFKKMKERTNWSAPPFQTSLQRP